MNKNFFKIQTSINLLDILKLLSISKLDFFKLNVNHDKKILLTCIDDFVSFANLSSNKLSFFINKKNNNSNVIYGLCIVEKSNANLLDNRIIKIPFYNPKLGFSKILENYFYNSHYKIKKNIIHPSAIIDPSAVIGKNVFIGAYTTIGEGVFIDNDSYISERVNITYNCKVGKRCFIGSGVFIECSIICNDVKVSPNTVIGKTGFGFIPDNSKTFLIPHMGGVNIGKGCTIGSCCTIDRGMLDDTTIGNFVMIDNQVHIGHNCSIGDFCILAGQVGLSGSVILKNNVTIGGDVSIKDNVTIGENTIIAGASKVFNSFPKNSKIGGSPAQDIIGWKRLIVSQRLKLKNRKNI